MEFSVRTEQLSDDAYVIALAGEVDLYTAPEFKTELLDVIAKGAKHVVIDLSETTFIDSTTLGVLVGGVKRLRTNDGTATSPRSSRSPGSTAFSRFTRRETKQLQRSPSLRGKSGAAARHHGDFPRD
jgi:anti-anti-sigma factor